METFWICLWMFLIWWSLTALNHQSYKYSITSTCDKIEQGICTEWTYTGRIRND